MRFHINLKAIFRHPFNRNERRLYRHDLISAYRRKLILTKLRRSSHLKTVLMVTNNWGGGTDRHLQELTQSVIGMLNVVNLRITDKELQLTIPEEPDHPLEIALSRREEIIDTLRQFGVARAHIHQFLGQESLIRSIIAELAIPFDLTVHDYYLICPQMHLCMPNTDRYCGEHGEKQCDQCVSINNPFGAFGIGMWRTQHAWFVENAERIICPTRDVEDRITKYYPRAKLVLAPHEASTSDKWIVKPRRISLGQPLRVALIGHLVAHKGREIVEACLRQGTQTPIEFVLIGAAQPPMSADLSVKFSQTGAYEESELTRLLEELAPHVIWFPQSVPETYSYTLTAAIDSGLPIVATRIGALPERLDGRPLTWLVDDADAPAYKRVATLESVRERLLEVQLSPQTGTREKTQSFYPAGYLSFLRVDSATKK